MTATNEAPACAAPDFAPRKTQYLFPELACDSHAHILGPSAEFAYSPNRVYTPPDCLMSDYRHMLDTLGVKRAVLVQPSVYGSDNTVMLKALDQGEARLRGVVVVEPDIAFSRLQAMHALGVRGVRVNLVDVKADTKALANSGGGPGQLPLHLLLPLAEKIAPLGWHMEFLMHVDEFPTLDQQLGNFPVPLVFGHLGYVRADTAKSTAGFAALLRLMRRERAWVKLTGPYRISQARTTSQGSPARLTYEHVAALAAELLTAAPTRVVWGTDWPHVMHKGTMPNDGALAELVTEWIPSAAQRQLVLVDNPAVLYDF